MRLLGTGKSSAAWTVRPIRNVTYCEGLTADVQSCLMKPTDPLSEIRAMLVCPRDRKVLHIGSDFVTCEAGHRYRIVEGIPILPISDVEQTPIEGSRALAVAETGDLSQLRQF